MEIVIYTIAFSLLCFLLSQSLSVHYSAFNFFDLSFAGIFVLSPNIYFYFHSILALPSYISILISLLISVITTIFIYKAIYIPLKERKVSNAILLIISIGIYGVLIGLIGVIFGSETRIILIPIFKDTSQLTIILFLVLFNTILWFIWKQTTFGKICRALFYNPTLISIQGINISKYYFLSACIISLIFSIAGLLISQEYGISNFIGFEYLLYGLSILLISGNYSTLYLLFSSLLFGFTIDFSAYYIGGQWKIAIAFIFLILILAINPPGLSKRKIKKSEI